MSITFAALTFVGLAGALSLCIPCREQPSSAAAKPELSAITAVAVPQHADTRVMQVAQPPVAPVAAIQTVTLKIEGMTCAGCVLSTRAVLTRLKGVSKADVSYESGRAVVTYDPKLVSVEQMIAAIKTLKYTATRLPG